MLSIASFEYLTVLHDVPFVNDGGIQSEITEFEKLIGTFVYLTPSCVSFSSNKTIW